MSLPMRTRRSSRSPEIVPNEDHVFPVVNIIFSHERVNGRGTLVSVVRKRIVGDVLSEKNHVLKLSSQYAARNYQKIIISQVRLAIPEWHDYPPESVFNATLCAADIGLPRARIRADLALNNCHLHVSVTNRFKNIWNTKSVAEFKRIFLDCLECHYRAWHSGKVRHHCISENSLMIFYSGLIEQDANASAPKGTLPPFRGIFNDFDMASELGPGILLPSRGILNDFDMAAELDVDGSVQLSAEPHHHITSTLPFMARDLLLRLDLSIIEEKMQQGIQKLDSAEAIMDEEVIGAKKAAELRLPKFHLYRYDLESFLYILIWAATHYELDMGVRRCTPQNSQLVHWEDPNLDAVIAAKQRLFSSPVYPALLKRGTADVAGNAEDSDFDYETCGGCITFEKFMSTIGETARGLNVVKT